MAGKKKNGKTTVKIGTLHPDDEMGDNCRHKSSLFTPRKGPEKVFWAPVDPASPKEEFKELITQNLKAEGFDDISSTIVSALFIEPEEMSLEEISIETGYSLSAVSTAMKNLSQYHIVRRFKKPGSKKVFFFLDKNLASIGAQALRMKYDNVILPSKKALPEIIKKYEDDSSDRSKCESEIISRYYKQILKLESIVDDFLSDMEKIDYEQKSKTK
jgi:DNA-binding transcriptional regulator GbsR (MarR family)